MPGLQGTSGSCLKILSSSLSYRLHWYRRFSQQKSISCCSENKRYIRNDSRPGRMPSLATCGYSKADKLSGAVVLSRYYLCSCSLPRGQSRLSCGMFSGLLGPQLNQSVWRTHLQCTTYLHREINRKEKRERMQGMST
jgi:hypothetical protein